MDNKNNIQISIVVPIYNTEKYLDDCIRSIINQTFTNWELILIDDGSTDTSGILCDQYADEDERIIVIHQKNAGVSAARNTGISYAQGEYVCFIDSDDVIDINFLKEMLIFDIESIAMVICGMKRKFIQNSQINYVEYVLKRENMSCETFLKKGISDGMIFLSSPCAKLYKNEYIKKRKIVFDEELNLGEDFYFNLDYLSNLPDEAVIISIGKAMYTYNNINPESLYNKYNADLYTIYEKTYNKMRTVFYQKCKDQTIRNRFEEFYVKNMIVCIKYEFYNNESSSKEKILDIIEKVINNQYIKNCKCSYIEKKADKLVFCLLKGGYKYLLYFFLKMLYKIKGII